MSNHTTTRPRFYAYILAEPDGTPFYAGKGQDDRIFEHEQEARRGHQCQKCDIIRAAWAAGQQIQRHVIHETDDEDEAFGYEAALIEFYGRKRLVNRTDGGRGVSGLIFSDATRARLSFAQKVNWGDPDYRSRLCAALRARWADPSYRAMMSARRRDQRADPAWRERLGAAIRAGKARKRSEGTAIEDTPEYRAKISAASKNVWADPDYRARMSAKAKARWADPDYRARMSAKAKARWADPDYRAKTTAGSKAAASTPERRAKYREAAKRASANPEVRAKISASVRAARARNPKETSET